MYHDEALEAEPLGPELLEGAVWEMEAVVMMAFFRKKEKIQSQKISILTLGSDVASSSTPLFASSSSFAAK